MGKMYVSAPSSAQASVTSRKRKKAKGGSQLATKADVKRMINSNEEFKAIYTHVETGNPYTGGAGLFTLLNGCSQGDGLSSREGREIRNRSVQIHLKHRYATSAPTYNYTLRAILFIDLEPHGSAPTASNLLRTSEGQGYDEAFRNLDYRNRFVILKDKYLQGDIFDNNGTTFVLHDHQLVKYKKLNLKTTFNSGNAGTIADINKGALYLYLFNAESANPMQVFISAVVRFTDN